MLKLDFKGQTLSVDTRRRLEEIQKEIDGKATYQLQCETAQTKWDNKKKGYPGSFGV